MIARTRARALAAVLGAAACALSQRPCGAAMLFSDATRAMQPPAERTAAVVLPRGMTSDLGRAPAALPVRVGFLLRARNESELAALVRRQGDRRSPYYHHYLSNAQWNDYFAPSLADVERASASLRANGFTIERIASNRAFLTVSAPAATVERYFSTELHRVRDGTRVTTANVRQATLPAAMRGWVAAVSGLHAQSVVVARGRRGIQPSLRASRPEVAANAATPKPVTTSTPGPNPNPEPTLQNGPSRVHFEPPAYGPVALANSYDYPVQHGYDGTGRTVANLIDGDYLDSDLATFENDFGITRTGTTTRIFLDGGTGTSTTAAFESTFDVEVIGGLAPGANYRLYIPPVLNDIEIQNGLNAIVADDLADVVSLSYGGCENYDPSLEYAEGYIAMQGAAKGITFAAATGDNGGLGCATQAGANLPGVLIPAAAYYFTAVGGTDLVANPTDGSYASETGYEMGGGGTSIFEAQPDWQAATPGTPTAGRSVPDVAIDASIQTGYTLVDKGTPVPEGGTSLATPLFAAMIAEIDQVQGTRNGWLNPRLYEIQSAQGYGFAFRDIIAGTNGMQAAATGYDLLTGLGSPRGWELAGTL